jgi:RNA polymerase primary sigma factor
MSPAELARNLAANEEENTPLTPEELAMAAAENVVNQRRSEIHIVDAPEEEPSDDEHDTDVTDEGQTHNFDDPEATNLEGAEDADSEHHDKSVDAIDSRAQQGEVIASATKAMIEQSIKKWGKKILTAEEEIKLAKRIEKGDLDAKDELIERNIRLVASVSRKYQNHGLTFDELTQEGMIGLIRAAEKFDWRKGFKFSTYSLLWIRQSIQRGLGNTGRAIRVPVHIAQRVDKVVGAEKRLVAELGREATAEEVAEKTNMTAEEVQDAREIMDQGVITSLNQHVSDSHEGSECWPIQD